MGKKFLMEKIGKKRNCLSYTGKLCHKKTVATDTAQRVKPGFSPILQKEQQPRINNVMIFCTLIRSNHHQFYFLCP